MATTTKQDPKGNGKTAAEATKPTQPQKREYVVLGFLDDNSAHKRWVPLGSRTAAHDRQAIEAVIAGFDEPVAYLEYVAVAASAWNPRKPPKPVTTTRLSWS